jgi:hypothetical protein
MSEEPSDPPPDWDAEAAEAQVRTLALNPPLLDGGKMVRIPFRKNKLLIFSDSPLTVAISAARSTLEWTTAELKVGLSVTCLCSSRHRLWDPAGEPDTFIKVHHRTATFKRLRTPFEWCEYLLLSKREHNPNLVDALDNRGPWRYGARRSDIPLIERYGRFTFSQLQYKLVHFNTDSTLNLACRFAFEFERCHFCGMHPYERMFAHSSDEGMTEMIKDRIDQALGYVRVGENVAGARPRRSE